MLVGVESMGLRRDLPGARMPRDRSRMMRDVHLWFFFSLGLGFACLPSAVRAQERMEYRALIEEAMREWEAGHWDESRGLFRAAHALEPNARTLRGIGMASFEMRDYPEAYRVLQAAMSETRHPLDEIQRLDVTSLLARIEARIGRYALVDVAEGAALELDGSPIDWHPGESIFLALGNHAIRMRASNVEAWRTVVVYGGESGSISFAPPAPEPAVVETPAALPGPLDRPDRRRPLRRPLEIAGMAGGGGLAAAGVVLLGLGVGDRNRVREARDGTEWAELAELNARAPRRIATGIGLAGLGLAGAAVAAGYFFHDRRDARRPVEVSISPTSVGVRGTF